MIHLRLRLAAAALSVCAFAACGGAVPFSVAPANELARPALSRTLLTLAARAATETPWLQGDTRLYVSNWNNSITIPPASPAPVANSLSVFDISRHDAPLTPVPVAPMLVPTFIAIDRVGKLYISNWSTRSVTIVDTQRGNAELPSITVGLTDPQGIALDLHGKLYVANGAQINVYDTSHGNAALPPIAANPSVGAITLDASGKLYIAEGSRRIAVVDTAHGNATLPPISFGGPGPINEGPIITGLTVDASGKLYAATSENGILVFDTLRSNAPLPVIVGNGLAGPAGMVTDEQGRLYVANSQFGTGNSVLVFDTLNANNFIGTLSGNGMQGVSALALASIDTTVTPQR